MLKKELWLVIFILLFISVKGDISGSISLGETRHFFTPIRDYSISFTEVDPFLEEAKFEINGAEYSLKRFQSVKFKDDEFIYLASHGNSLNDFSVDFFISTDSYYKCEGECKNNSFVTLMQKFDPEFELCKLDCTVGCDLYKEGICNKGDLWRYDNCGNKLDKIKDCKYGCLDGECINCGNRVCDEGENYFNCKDCSKPNYCISEKDCSKNCISGQCTGSKYILGDGICSLPLEPCSSQDCSCNNVVSKGRDDLPIVIIHGFASTPKKLEELQTELAYDIDYDFGGQISIYDFSCDSIERKTVYVATYYKNKDIAKESNRVKDYLQNSYQKIMEEEREEDNFAYILGEVIEKVKACANTEKVNVIAHSMGGVVLRGYLDLDNNIKNINKAIFLGVPHKGGIYGSESYELVKGLEAELGDRKDLLKKCSSLELPSVLMGFVDGRDVTDECQQIQNIGKTNTKIDETPGLVEYYTIAGKVDGMGDGMVPVESASLNGAVANYVVACDHFGIKDPSKCEEGYLKVLETLGYDESYAHFGFIDRIKKFFFWLGR